MEFFNDKLQTPFMEFDFEADKLRIKAELRVILVELQLKSNWTKLKLRLKYSSLQTKTLMWTKMKTITVKWGARLTGL